MAFFRTRKPLQVIDDNFREGGFNDIQSFINDNFASTSLLYRDAPPFELYAEEFEGLDRNTLFWIITDRGRGRVSLGLQSLFAMAMVLSNKTYSGVTLFNNIIGSNPEEFSQADSDRRVEIVMLNLGTLELYNATKTRNPTVADRYLETCSDIAFDMMNNKYTVEKYKKSVLLQSRALARIVSNS